MPLSADFDFIQAKIHGLRSRVYELRRLDALCDLTSIVQLWHRLYPEENAGDHHALQRRLLDDHVAVLETVRQHLPERFLPFYTWLLRRYQVENLKVALRGWKAKEPAKRIARFVADLPSDFALPVSPLLSAPSLADFLMLVPVPELRRAGEKGAAHHAETGETFFVELAFDAAYYAELLERRKTLRGEHRRVASDLVRHEAAMYNLLALFRLKLNYELPREQAEPFFVPVEPHPFRLERLYDRPHFDDMLDVVPQGFLPKHEDLPLRTVADLERALWKRLLVKANRQFYRSTADLGGVLSFTIIKRVELANLIRVIEGVRYALSADAIRAGLIRVPQPAAR